MSKLSSIEDVERRARQEQERAARAAEADPAPRENQTSAAAQPTSVSDPASDQGDMTAEQEEEFHGLDTTPPMGVGHKALIVIAVVVVIVAILYIVNSWIHFI